MYRLLLFAALIAGLASGAPAATPPDVMEEPEWVRKPGGKDVANHYPDRALRRDVSGWAVVVCRVQASGEVKGCKVGAESPSGYDFGKATLALSKLFRMKTSDRYGPGGAIVAIPVVWALNGEAPPKSASPGQPALIPSVAPAGASNEKTFSCATKADPKRRCLAHGFEWSESPTIFDIEPLARAAGDEPSVMACRVAGDGRLSECDLSRGHSAEMREQILSLAPRFRAKPQTVDQVATADATALITFDWKTLRGLLDTYDAVRSGK